MPLLFLTPTDGAIVSQLQPNTNFGPQQILFVRRTGTLIDVFRGLLNFDLAQY